MKRVIFACLGAVALTLGMALPAQAATPFIGPPWQETQSVITVSDRNGYDLNENEAAYAWGSYSNDDMSMAYTAVQTCTYCIKVYTGSVGSGLLYSTSKSTFYDAAGWRWVRACSITVDMNQVGTYWKQRQAVMTHAIGHCLGLGDATAGDSIMNHYNLTHPDNAYTPSIDDHTALSVWYTYPRKPMQ